MQKHTRMRIIKVSAINFGSYENIDLDYSEYEGVCLFSGATGSGKSTLCDLVPWVLYGYTAKNGAVDEVINWYSENQTEGTVTVRINPNCQIEISRKRRPNDLFYKLGNSTPDTGDLDSGTNGTLDPIRGKDLNDTQKQINKLLGIDIDTYLLGAYFNEFSPIATFFTTTAKTRRSICNQLIDSTLLKKLTSSLPKAKSKSKKQLDDMIVAIDKLNMEQNLLTNEQNVLESNSTKWERVQKLKIKQLAEMHSDFENAKELKLQTLELEFNALDPNVEAIRGAISLLKQEMIKSPATCSECGGPKQHGRLEDLNNLKQLEIEALHDQKRKENLATQLLDIKSQKNTYSEQIKTAKGEDNPYRHLLDANRTRTSGVRERMGRAVEDSKRHRVRFLALESLSEITSSLRGRLLISTVEFLETNTNDLIDTYFDGLFKIHLSIDEDEIDISITKDNQNCVYTQLSKGQRQIIKFCFALSTMEAVSRQHGVDFSSIFLDEAMDGMDVELKLKAIKLIKSMSSKHSSVFVIDHATEIKSFVDREIEVLLVEGKSYAN